MAGSRVSGSIEVVAAASVRLMAVVNVVNSGVATLGRGCLYVLRSRLGSGIEDVSDGISGVGPSVRGEARGVLAAWLPNRAVRCRSIPIVCCVMW